MATYDMKITDPRKSLDHHVEVNDDPNAIGNDTKVSQLQGSIRKIVQHF